MANHEPVLVGSTFNESSFNFRHKAQHELFSTPARGTLPFQHGLRSPPAFSPLLPSQLDSPAAGSAGRFTSPPPSHGPGSARLPPHTPWPSSYSLVPYSPSPPPPAGYLRSTGFQQVRQHTSGADRARRARETKAHRLKRDNVTRLQREAQDTMNEAEAKMSAALRAQAAVAAADADLRASEAEHVAQEEMGRRRYKAELERAASQGRNGVGPSAASVASVFAGMSTASPPPAGVGLPQPAQPWRAAGTPSGVATKLELLKARREDDSAKERARELEIEQETARLRQAREFRLAVERERDLLFSPQSQAAAAAASPAPAPALLAEDPIDLLSSSEDGGDAGEDVVDLLSSGDEVWEGGEAAPRSPSSGRGDASPSSSASAGRDAWEAVQHAHRRREVHEDVERLYWATLRGPRNVQLAVHPRTNILVTGEHAHSLKAGGWLTDEVINFYMSLLVDRERDIRQGRAAALCGPDAAAPPPSAHCFSTFFMNKLYTDLGYQYEAVRRWTTPQRLALAGQPASSVLDVDRIILPVHQGMHWVCAVVDLAAKEISYYDSMGGQDRRVTEALARYIKDEYRNKKGQEVDTETWPQLFPECPQQRNGYDCGVFTVMVAAHVAAGRPLDFSQEDMPFFRRCMLWEIINGKLLL